MNTPRKLPLTMDRTKRFKKDVFAIFNLVIFQKSGQIITASAEVTLNCGLVRESPQNPLIIQV